MGPAPAAAEAAAVARPARETRATVPPSVVDEDLEEGEAKPWTRQTALVVGGARNISFKFKPPSKQTVCTVDQRARTKDGEGRWSSATPGQTAQRPATATAGEDQSQQMCKPLPVSNAVRLSRAAAVAAAAAAAEADGAEATAGEPSEAASGQCTLPKTALAAGSRQDDGPFAEEVDVDVLEVS